MEKIKRKISNILILLRKHKEAANREELHRLKIEQEYRKRYGRTKQEQAQREMDEFMREGGKYTLADPFGKR